MLIIYHEAIKFVNTNFEIAKNEKNISNKDTFILCGDFNVDFHQFEKMKKA